MEGNGPSDRENHLMTKLLCTLTALLALALPAAAQTTPTTPPDVDLYRFELFLSTADYDANTIATFADIPVAWVTCDLDPDPGAPGPFFEVTPDGTAAIQWNDVVRPGRACRTQNVMPLLVTILSPYKNQEFPWRVRALGKVTAPEPQPLVTLRKPGVNACLPPPGRQTVLSVTVNSTYPQTAPGPNAQLNVNWRMSNTRAVVYAQVLLNNVEVASASGTDLSRTLGMYFTGPSQPGTYNLTVYARDVAGCDYRSGLTRQVVVK